MKTIKITSKATSIQVADIVNTIFDNVDHDVLITIGGTQVKIDHVVTLADSSKLFVSFQDITHFTNDKVIDTDLIITQYCKDNNITEVKIPYFFKVNFLLVLLVSFGPEIYSEYIDGKIKLVTTTKTTSGFKSMPTNLLPSAYTAKGWESFVGYYVSFIDADIWSPAKEIYESVCDNSTFCKFVKATETNSKYDNSSLPPTTFLQHYPT